MKHFDRKKIYRACAAALCGALALGSGAAPFGTMTALASPEFARTAEEGPCPGQCAHLGRDTGSRQRIQCHGTKEPGDPRR